MAGVVRVARETCLRLEMISSQQMALEENENRLSNIN